MSFESILLLALLACAFVAFFREIFPVEVTALGLLTLLLALGLVPLDQAFSGLANKAVISIGALFVLADALTRTGVLEIATEALSRRLAPRGGLATGLVLTLVALSSGLLNNTAVVAMGIPLMITLSTRFSLSRSKVLLPLSYAAIFGGTLTLIGTSTNLLVSSIIEDQGLRPLGMFEFTPLGSLFLVAGLAYVFLFSGRLLPETRAGSPLTRRYDLGKYLTEAVIQPSSRLIGKTVTQANLNERYGTLVLEILRGDSGRFDRIETLPLRAGDRLLVEGSVEDLLRLRREQGVSLLSDVPISDKLLAADALTLVEVVVLPAGTMVGKTLVEADFRRLYGGFILAIRRSGTTLQSRIARVRLHAADSLVVLVPARRLEELREGGDLVVVSELALPLKRGRAWWLVLVLLPAVVILAASGALEIALGAPAAVVLLLMTGALSPQQVYRAVDWTVLFLIAAFIPVGQAVVSTGTAELLASGLVSAGRLVPGDATPYVVLSLLYLATSLITELISNNAAAIILVPIALSLGPAMGVDPRAFVMAVCFGASAAFMTPTGYQTNLMVYGAGGYRFGDYARFGAPLNLLFWIVASLLLPVFWPF